MNRRLFTRAIVERRRSATGLILGIAVLTGWIAAIFPIVRDSDAFTGFLEDFPPQMAALLGIDPATYLTGAGYLGAQIFSLFAPLMMIGFTVEGALHSTAREEREGTMDMLLATPVSRSRVLLERGGATAFLSLLVAAALAVTLAAANPVVDLRLSVVGIVAACASLWLLGMVFGALALAVGAFLGRPGAARGTTFGIAFGFWLITGFEPIYTWLSGPSSVSPFTWYEANNPLLSPWSSGQIWLVLTSVAITGAAVALFKRRDIATEQAVVPKGARIRLGRSVHHAPRAQWMLTNVFRKTVRDRRLTIWAWISGIAVLLIVTFTAWPSISQDAAALQELISALPPEVFAMFGLSDPAAMTQAPGFISSRAYQSVGPIVVVVFAIGSVTSLIAKEETSGALDMVLSNPVSRRSMLLQKIAAIAALLGVVAVALTTVSLIGNQVWGTRLDISRIVAANVGLALLGVAFAGITLALWSLLRSSSSAVRATTAVATFAWFANGLGAIVDVLGPVRRLSPFYWYLGDVAPLGKGFEPSYVFLLLVGGLGAFVARRRIDSRDLAV